MTGKTRWPQPILQVIRVKPGEARTVEVALPWVTADHLGTSGRNYACVDVIPHAEGAEPTEPTGLRAGEACSMGTGVVLVCEGDRPAFSVRAAPDAPPGMIDVRVTYCRFTAGTGEHFLGLRVVVEAP